MRDWCPVIVFVKAPVAGFAKTRLIPALGADDSARLAERLLEATIRQACAATIGPVDLCCDPDLAHPVFTRMAQDFGVTLRLQGDGDLGVRMSRALGRVLGDYRRALLIGTDAPALDAGYLRTAARALSEHDAVFGPASDGGYTLVGLRKPAHDLFSDITWGTHQVMEQTRLRLKRLDLRYFELPVLSDVDEPEDLIHVPKEWLVSQ